MLHKNVLAKYSGKLTCSYPGKLLPKCLGNLNKHEEIWPTAKISISLTKCQNYFWRDNESWEMSYQICWKVGIECPFYNYTSFPSWAGKQLFITPLYTQIDFCLYSLWDPHTLQVKSLETPSISKERGKKCIHLKIRYFCILK